MYPSIFTLILSTFIALGLQATPVEELSQPLVSTQASQSIQPSHTLENKGYISRLNEHFKLLYSKIARKKASEPTQSSQALKNKDVMTLLRSAAVFMISKEAIPVHIVAIAFIALRAFSRSKPTTYF
jgi:hypothetical protein